MRLSQLRQKQSGQSSGQHFEYPNEPGTIRQSVTYPRPIDGFLDGKPISILACGDITGMSPAVQFVDENGRLDWVSESEVTLVQRDVLPQSQESFNRLSGSSRQTTSSGR